MAKKSRLKFGTNGDDTLDGTDDGEVFFGFGGNDTIFGRGGKDVAFGGRGDDLIFGGNGKDHLFGRSGNDALVGEADKDHLLGGRGRDLLLGGPGKDVMVGGPGDDTFLIRKGTGVDIIADLQSGDRIDIRDFNFASFQAVLNAAQRSHGDVVINLGGGDQLVIEHTKLSDLHAEQFIISSQITGPSSSQSPYLVSTNSHVTIESILTVGDSIGGYKMAGIPDGLGAYDNGDGTFTVLMNHEIAGGLGAVRAHGANGAFVSQWVIDKTTLQVQSGHDLIQHVFVAADGFSVDHSAANGNGITFSRFCSADLADPSAFYNAASGLGYNAGRLFLDGEESGVEGRPFAHIASGPEAGKSYELAALGNMAYENLLANPHTGNKTVVAVTDDGQNGQVYFYYGDKQSTGSAIDKAGLTGGHLFGIKVADFAATSDNAPNSTTPLGADEQSAFTLVDLGDVSGMTGAQIDQASENAGVATFLRPEDGAWDTINPNRFYFVTTNAFNSPSQLWAADFVDAANPALGGNIKLLLNGSEGQQMFDNITVDGSGKVTLCEDVGNNAHLGKVWQYDPAADSLTQLAVHDSSRFETGGANFLTQDEEASGVIDISNILGNAGEHVFLVDTQAHNALGGELVEGGQLMIMHQYLV
jgi:RTX calcium-binding nonapeptide repeat (4 copies)